MPRFLSCFRNPQGPARDTEASDGLLSRDGHDIRPVKPECIFCNVRKPGFDIVYEVGDLHCSAYGGNAKVQDDDLIAFKDRAPGAATHLLVIPRYHLVHDLRLRHLPMLRSMQTLGLSLTRGQELDPKMGFHIPPFSSVHHLHLHVLVPPYNLRGRFKYPERRSADGQGKKWGWFVTIDQVESILESGQTVSLGHSHPIKQQRR